MHDLLVTIGLDKTKYTIVKIISPLVRSTQCACSLSWLVENWQVRASAGGVEETDGGAGAA